MKFSSFNVFVKNLLINQNKMQMQEFYFVDVCEVFQIWVGLIMGGLEINFYFFSRFKGTRKYIFISLFIFENYNLYFNNKPIRNT
ncbi:hypothetical protein ASG21_10910 [Chryseobacterium sp. Leaf394]|nr:hypothetical protein ASG21_10910 [Chryseobacterium sp. Leaf394]